MESVYALDPLRLYDFTCLKPWQIPYYWQEREHAKLELNVFVYRLDIVVGISKRLYLAAISLQRALKKWERKRNRRKVWSIKKKLVPLHPNWRQTR